MSPKLGDLPTMKLDTEELARVVRNAEATLRDADVERETFRPPPDFADVEISVELDEVESPPIVEARRVDSEAPPAALLTEVISLDGSEARQQAFDEQAAKEGAAAAAELASVPFVVASRDDLAWFELDELSSIVLGLVDGEATIDAIRQALALPPDKTLAILRDLRSHGVIELTEPR